MLRCRAAWLSTVRAPLAWHVPCYMVQKGDLFSAFPDLKGLSLTLLEDYIIRRFQAGVHLLKHSNRAADVEGAGGQKRGQKHATDS